MKLFSKTIFIKKAEAEVIKYPNFLLPHTGLLPRNVAEVERVSYLVSQGPFQDLDVLRKGLRVKHFRGVTTSDEDANEKCNGTLLRMNPRVVHATTGQVSVSASGLDWMTKGR